MAKDLEESAAETAERTRRNRRALGSLVIGKLLGIVGVILAFSAYRWVGGALLFFAFVFVGASIALTTGAFRKQKHAALSDAAVLEKMVREGTLKAHLRDVEQKLRAERDEHEREIKANTEVE